VGAAEQVPEVLTHYYRPFSLPFLSLSPLSEPEASRVLSEIACFEPLPYRLTHPAYLSERRRIEGRMRQRFLEKGGRPERDDPHYLVLGEFSLWESDGSLKVRIPLSSVSAAHVSFTLTDSFFNFRETNLRGLSIPRRAYHGELFTCEELPSLIRRHGLPGDAWRSDPERRFDVYIEAQLWHDEPIRQFVGRSRAKGAGELGGSPDPESS
jgi:hypothetical protein